MSKKIFTETKPKSVDEPLNTLESIKQKKEAIIAEELETIKQIRSGFQEVVVLFIDMVDSTKFKTTTQDTPEKWILRVRQFSEIVGQYINECGGRIVKYIGDELLAVFNRDSKINDSINLLNRIKDLQRDLSEITGESTTVKIALDFGNVYFLEYIGHQEPDPQGTPVDRCARIAKYCKAGIALTSFELVKNCDHPNLWTNIGEAELKGIGPTRIFQFGEGTIDIIPTTEISETELKSLRDKTNQQKAEIENLTLKNNEAISINKELNEKLKESGASFDQSLVIEKDSNEVTCERNWDVIKTKITTLKKIINECTAPSSEYARFLFLYLRDEYWEYNSFTNDTFDASIESNLIRRSAENDYQLDPDNRRNRKAIEVMDDIEFHLEKYESQCRNYNDTDLFDFSLKSPEFWAKYIGYTVVTRY